MTAQNPSGGVQVFGKARSASAAEMSPVKALLDSCLPPADAKRLAHLFASFGIKDLAYLYVLARMRTRDRWLDELRGKGHLTEIQLRVVREVLDRLSRSEYG